MTATAQTAKSQRQWNEEDAENLIIGFLETSSDADAQYALARLLQSLRSLDVSDPLDSALYCLQKALFIRTSEFDEAFDRFFSERSRQ